MPKPLTMWITISVENSERDGNTRPPDLPLEKPVSESPMETLEKAIVLHHFWTEGLTSF